jgi:CPA1 family monovalent cation:H+ antiporter
MVVILEGESLLNDATALLIYRLAVTAAMGTPFTTASIGPQALAMVGSVVAGFVSAHVITRLLEMIEDVPSTIILQFVGAFGVWILAEKAGLSAIVTVVVFAVTAARVVRTPAHIRLPSYAVWTTVVFVLNVVAFMLIGLQLRPILADLGAGERVQYLQIAVAVLGMVVGVRIAWVMLYNRLAWLKEKFFGPGYWPGPYRPSFGGSLVVSWCGMRGIVTLATAYALPVNFPYRELMLLCAFAVVVGTLILQGLTLRPLIAAMKLEEDGTVDQEILATENRLAKIAEGIIDGDQSEAARVLRAEFLIPAEDRAAGGERASRNQLRGRVLAAQRAELLRLRNDAEIGDDAFHVIEERLDIFEVSLRS